jgi:hypothetical protein
MKKFKFIVLTFMLLVALMVSTSTTYASSSDLYDDTEGNLNGGEVIQLLENSEYQINVVSIDQGGMTFGNMLDIDRNDFTLSIFANGLIDETMTGGAAYWENSTWIDKSWTIETTNEVSLDIIMETNGPSSLLEEFANEYDVQVLWLGNTGQVDNVAPEYTYSQAEIDTPYYDLVTVQEIQNQLQAVDDEEGDVSDRIQVYEDHYTAVTPKVVGNEYFIMFMVDDTAGNSAYLRVDINVIDDKKPKYDDGIGYISDGSTITLSWYDENYNNELDTHLGQLSVYDEYYGTVSFESATAEANGWSFNRAGDWGSFDATVPGNYLLNIVATDPSGNSTYIIYDVTVLDNQAPVISGESSVSFSIDRFNLDDILDEYSATDPEDGVVEVTIKTHNVSEDTISTYSATLSAIDSFGRETIKNITVILVDVVAPVIKVEGIETSNYSHTVYMSDTTTLQALIDNIDVYDDYEGLIKNGLVVPELPSFAVPGTHNLTLTASDSSGNVASLNLEVIVVDDIAPVVNGAIKIVKGLNETLTLSNILATLTVTDNVDNNLELELVSDAYTGNSGNVGSYLVKYKVTDISDNTTYHSVRIWVVDNQAPAWILNDYFVNLGINESMTRSELVSLLQSAGMIGSDISYTVTFVSDEYTGNETVEGAYQVVMNITYENGSEEQLSVELNVPEQTSDDVIVVTPEENLTGLQKLWNTLKNIVVSIWNGIKTVGKFIWNGIIVPVYEFIFVKDVDVIPTDDDVTTQITTLTLPFTPTTDPPINQV